MRRGERFFVRGVDDLVPDHNHLMHLYAIRQPGLDAVYHLHPERTAPGMFRHRLPAMLPGTYRLYADIVHANGFPETLVAAAQIPAFRGRPLSGDDAAGAAAPWKSATVPTSAFSLPGGYRMQWLDAASVPRAREPRYFRFCLLDPHGQPARDMSLYMGMPGHAAFVKTDDTVFAHVHPTGSVSMAAFVLAQNASVSSMAAMDMSAMDARSTSLPANVAFPYGFPTPGRYRIFVQMKHGNTIETGVFDTEVK